MEKYTINRMLTIASLLVSILFFTNTRAQETTHLEKRGDVIQLIVDGKPFLVLGGELHNSSSSNLAYLDSLWQPLQQKNLNTVLAAVSWQLIEPDEGNYDFTLVDDLIRGARKHELKLILLWFGSWKNGLSHYAPTWVKRDVERFPRITLENGASTETISVLSTETLAETNAFSSLMAHIKEVDKDERTVIMIQVENEVGIIGNTRDFSDLANKEFLNSVPNEIIDELEANSANLLPAIKKYWIQAGSKTEGNWTEIFGDNYYADEAFMAWHYARYINTIASAGKAVYNIPMYVNAWIVQPNDKKPGDYPSGGPQAHVHDIWRIAAPSIDILALDVYLPNFIEISDQYHHSWNPLFVPESFSGDKGAANAFYAIGNHSGIGYSPFGIDNVVENPSQTPIAKAYKVLGQLTPEITEAQAKNAIKAVCLNKEDSIQILSLGGYEITVTLRKHWSGKSLSESGYGLILHSGTDEFIIAGSDLSVVFVPDSPGPKMAGFASVYEGEYKNGVWIPGRLLNGDAIMVSYNLAEEAAANKTGTAAKLMNEPGILKIKLYRFE